MLTSNKNTAVSFIFFCSHLYNKFFIYSNVNTADWCQTNHKLLRQKKKKIQKTKSVKHDVNCLRKKNFFLTFVRLIEYKISKKKMCALLKKIVKWCVKKERVKVKAIKVYYKRINLALTMNCRQKKKRVFVFVVVRRLIAFKNLSKKNSFFLK